MKFWACIISFVEIYSCLLANCEVSCPPPTLSSHDAAARYHKYDIVITCISKRIKRSSWTACKMLDWWNLLWTLRCLSRSFLPSTFSSRASTSWLSNTAEYCDRPRLVNQAPHTQRWSSDDAFGYCLPRANIIIITIIIIIFIFRNMQAYSRLQQRQCALIYT